MRTRWLIVPLLLGLLLGCEALKPPPEPESDSEPDAIELREREGLDTPRASVRKRSPSRWLDVDWPPALRLIESGVAGPSKRPVLWYRFGLDSQTPEDAAALALDALERISSGTPLRSLHADADSGRVVGQLRGESFAASVAAENSTASRELRVTIELLNP